MTCEGDRRVPAALGNSSDAIAQMSKALELDPSLRPGSTPSRKCPPIDWIVFIIISWRHNSPQNRRVTASNMDAQPRK